MNRRDAVSGLLAFAAAVTSSRACAQRAKLFRIAWFPDFGPITRRVTSDVMGEVGWTEGVDFMIVPSGF